MLQGNNTQLNIDAKDSHIYIYTILKLVYMQSIEHFEFNENTMF